ncbi:MAG: magnesium transporter [Proteobacteria bacterium]|nr:magnesium transporter [Pseudomonadota bacterium]MDA0952623.1 magnesium transporter [Pseudomonadota bacterium]
MSEAAAIDDSAREGQDLYGLTPELLHAILEALDQEDVNRLEALVVPLHAADTADLLEQITPGQRAQVVAALEPDIDPDILAYLGESTLEDVRDLLGNDGFAHLVRQLDVDDAVEVIGEFDDEDQREILAAVPAAERRMVEEALTFPEESAGRLMRRDVVALPMFWNIGQTIDYLRGSKDLPSEFYAVFVVDPAHKLVGMISLHEILRNPRDVKLASLVTGEPTTVQADMDQEEVAYLFQQYGLTEVAVVDQGGRLLGAVTFDDMVDVINEESEEDVLRLGGVAETDLNDSIVDTTRKRFVWLLVNFGTAVLASLVIGMFADTLQTVVALAVLMPIVASMGGNAGTQSMTVAVRALATKDLTEANALRVIGKEIAVGLLNGLIFAALMGVVAWLWFSSPMLGGVIAGAMIANLLVAGMSGALIPLLLSRLNVDPAVAAGVFLTTVTDVVGFLVFLALGAVFLL